MKQVSLPARYAWLEDCIRCNHCRMYPARQHEHDHLPTPRICGEQQIVPVYINCHNLKALVGLSNWPVGGAFAVSRDKLERGLDRQAIDEQRADELWTRPAEVD